MNLELNTYHLKGRYLVPKNLSYKSLKQNAHRNFLHEEQLATRRFASVFCRFCCLWSKRPPLCCTRSLFFFCGGCFWVFFCMRRTNCVCPSLCKRVLPEQNSRKETYPFKPLKPSYVNWEKKAKPQFLLKLNSFLKLVYIYTQPIQCLLTCEWTLLMWTSVYNNYYSVYLFQWEETIKVFRKLQITLLSSLSYDSSYKPIVKEGSQQHFFRTHINKGLISHWCPILPNTDRLFFTALSKSLPFARTLITWEFVPTS